MLFISTALLKAQSAVYSIGTDGKKLFRWNSGKRRATKRLGKDMGQKLVVG